MTSRLMRKILKERSEQEINKLAAEYEELEKTVETTKSKKMFELLLDSDEDEDEDEAEEEEVEKEEKEEEKEEKEEEKEKEKKKETGQNEKTEKTEINKRISQKKKKKKKKKVNPEEEFDKMLSKCEEEIKAEKAKGTYNRNKKDRKKKTIPVFSACTTKDYNRCLYIYQENFDVDSELRKIFGEDITAKKEMPYRKLSRIQLLKSWLVQDFTKKIITPPIKMLYENNAFVFDRSETYEIADDAYYIALNSFDISLIHKVLKKYPFHINSFLSLADYYNERRDFVEAGKCINAALLLLQNCFHLKFHPDEFNETTNNYMDPWNVANKMLFKALYLHMVALENEACVTTSLEVAKLILRISARTDACAILLRIDNLIMKCRQFEYLILFSFNFVLEYIELIIPRDRAMEIYNLTLRNNSNTNSMKNDSNCSNLQDNVTQDVEDVVKMKTENLEDNWKMGNGTDNWITEQEEKLEEIKEEEIMTTEKETSEEVLEENEKKETSEEASKEKEKNEMPEKMTKEISQSKSEQMEEEEEEEDSKKVKAEDASSKNNNLLQNIKKNNSWEYSAVFGDLEFRLHLILPNFAFSIPLSLYLKANKTLNMNSLNLITHRDIMNSFSLEECKYLIPHFHIYFKCYKNQKTKSKRQRNNKYSLSFSANLMLIRAILCYPTFLTLFLRYNNFSTTKMLREFIYENTFSDVLKNPPFTNESLFSKEETQILDQIIRCYLEKNNMYYKSEKVITWFHSCSSFIYNLHKDKQVADMIKEQLYEWKQRKKMFDFKKYMDVRVSQFKSQNGILPNVILDGEENRADARNAPEGYESNSSGNYYVSLDSNLVVAFLQSMLPWYQIDHDG